MRKTHVNKAVWLCLALIFMGVTFFVVDMQTVPVGDDLGYMFTDSAHHLGDGHRVRTLSDINWTLTSHYLTTNGRFIVHWLAMFFLNIAGKTWFCLSNTLVFLLTLFCFARLCIQRSRMTAGKLVTLTLLVWIAVPFPGTTWLGLICYATNYLWTAAATLLILVFIEDAASGETYKGFSGALNYKVFSYTALSLLFIVFGSMQESFSLPMSAGLLSLWIKEGRTFGRIRCWATVCYWIGTAVCTFAPGNMGHAAQGGGFTVDAVINRIAALFSALLTECPVVIPVLVVFILLVILKPGDVKRFILQNILLLTALVTALILACLTFTAARQLTFPMLLTAILGVRALMIIIGADRLQLFLNNIGVPYGVILYSICFIGAWCLREETSQRFSELHTQAERGERCVVFRRPSTTERVLSKIFGRYGYAQLPVIFDRYTKQGLSRLYSADEKRDYIMAVLPETLPEIERMAKKSSIKDGEIRTVKVTDRYRCFLVPPGLGVAKLHDEKGMSVPFEHIETENGVIVVVPDNEHTQTLSFSGH